MTKDELKQLLEIAKVCRKAGITSFKSESFEFTLTDEPPAPLKPRGKSAAKKSVNSDSSSLTEIETDSLSDEELLLWSVGVSPESASQ